MNILIADDDPSVQVLLLKYLSEFGSCVAAANGHDAVEEFRRSLLSGSPYDLVCMDINMPLMDGQVALQEIRRLEKEAGLRGPQQAKAIVLSAFGDTRNVTHAFFRGEVSAYVTKPFSRDAFLGEFRKLFPEKSA